MGACGEKQTCKVMPTSHWLMTIWWNPSSHKKPRGKDVRLGVAVRRDTAGARVSSSDER
jgi:hypothetical protein